MIFFLLVNPPFLNKMISKHIPIVNTISTKLFENNSTIYPNDEISGRKPNTNP